VARALAERNIRPMGGTRTTGGLRRMAIRDPWCGVVIEVWEDGPGLPKGRGRGDTYDPLIIYSTASVPDLAAARRFYGEVVGFPILPLETLHAEADEALWGLAGARREGFVVDAGDAFVEVVEYSSPSPKPRGADYRLSDQGIMNIGFFARDNDSVREVIERLDAEGAPPRFLTTGQGVLGAYINQPAREVEFLSCPEAVERYIGFEPQGLFNASEAIRMRPYSRELLRGG
jgi:catechol 2,3-dioxygenase-like lactoylglutathione lyase family enzyme